MDNQLCAVSWVLFMHVYIANVAFTYSATITYLLYLVLHLVHFKGSLSHSKVVNCVVELSCIFIPFILPLTFLWTPFTHNGFGLEEFFCWIKDVDNNCTGIYTDYNIIIMYSASEATLLEMLVSSAIVFVVYCRMHGGVERKHIHTLIRKICIILVIFQAVGFAVATALFGLAFYLEIFSLKLISLLCLL